MRKVRYSRSPADPPAHPKQIFLRPRARTLSRCATTSAPRLDDLRYTSSTSRTSSSESGWVERRAFSHTYKSTARSLTCVVTWLSPKSMKTSCSTEAPRTTCLVKSVFMNPDEESCRDLSIRGCTGSCRWWWCEAHVGADDSRERFRRTARALLFEIPYCSWSSLHGRCPRRAAGRCPRLWRRQARGPRPGCAPGRSTWPSGRRCARGRARTRSRRQTARSARTRPPAERGAASAPPGLCVSCGGGCRCQGGGRP
mmetsp:Transcript_2958/g.7420  ORF Transcript_2958/g.7420 Transcript_2958/m.7420 type:complete len:255 (+) Transcript_2958:87-851(+)